MELPWWVAKKCRLKDSTQHRTDQSFYMAPMIPTCTQVQRTILHLVKLRPRQAVTSQRSHWEQENPGIRTSSLLQSPDTCTLYLALLGGPLKFKNPLRGRITVRSWDEADSPPQPWPSAFTWPTQLSRDQGNPHLQQPHKATALQILPALQRR